MALAYDASEVTMVRRYAPVRLIEHGWLIGKHVQTVGGRAGRIHMHTEDYKQVHVKFSDGGRLLYPMTALKILG